MLTIRRLSVQRALALTGFAALAACATPAPPPPPPVVEAVPYRPIPPVGSTYVMPIPPLGADGVRQTVNTGLDENDTIWNLRSVWNVAAHNCLDEAHKPILDR